MRLQDHVSNNRNMQISKGHGQASSLGKKCWKFNKGKCTYGFNCKFDHRCGICNKFDHGAHNCRRGNSGPHQNSEKSFSDREGDGDAKERKYKVKEEYKK